MEIEKSAEAILRLQTTTEGPNLKLRGVVFDCAGEGDVAIKTERFWTYIQQNERNSWEGM